MTDVINIYADTSIIRNVPYRFLWMAQMGYQETSNILLEVYVYNEINRVKKEDNK